MTKTSSGIGMQNVGDARMTEATVGGVLAPAAGEEVVAGRGRRKTLAPVALARISPASFSESSTSGPFEVLVHDVLDSSSESCASDVPTSRRWR
jgi:hypothetical protein